MGTGLEWMAASGDPAPVGERVWIERLKWPGTPHYGVVGTVLGADEHGTWLGAPPGHQVTKQSRLRFRGRGHIVWCVPHDGWYLIHYVPEHDNIDIYIDIASPVRWSRRGAQVIDLDFDVVVRPDGRVQLVDEDEFEQHLVELGYPDALADGARAAAADVFARVQQGEPPFTMATAKPWFDALGQHLGRPAP